MPPNVRRFFEDEDPAPYRQPESGQDRLEREARASFGGWCCDESRSDLYGP
jgi:hypothetical protein